MSFYTLKVFFSRLSDLTFLSLIETADFYNRRVLVKRQYWNTIVSGFLARRDLSTSAKHKLISRLKEIIFWRLGSVSRRSFFRFFAFGVSASFSAFLLEYTIAMEHATRAARRQEADRDRTDWEFFRLGNSFGAFFDDQDHEDDQSEGPDQPEDPDNDSIWRARLGRDGKLGIGFGAHSITGAFGTQLDFLEDVDVTETDGGFTIGGSGVSRLINEQVSFLQRQQDVEHLAAQAVLLASAEETHEETAAVANKAERDLHNAATTVNRDPPQNVVRSRKLLNHETRKLTGDVERPMLSTFEHYTQKLPGSTTDSLRRTHAQSEASQEALNAHYRNLEMQLRDIRRVTPVEHWVKRGTQWFKDGMLQPYGPSGPPSGRGRHRRR